LAIETGQFAGVETIVVGCILDHLQLLELGDQVADRLLSELLVQLLERVLAVECPQQPQVFLAGALDPDVTLGTGSE
jgi:hypothetical protein